MKQKSKLLPLLGIFTIFTISFITIGYSALNTNLTLSGDAYVRVDENIRVADFKMTEATNEAYETYTSQYSKDSASIFVSLPNANSSITYEGTITNISDDTYYLADIIEESITNDQINYQFVDLSIGDIIKPHTSKKYTITFHTTKGKQTGSFILKHQFQKMDQTTFAYNYTGNTQTFVAPYNGTYKLETWGASGNVVNLPYLKTGYGGYASGEVTLTAGTTLYLQVGGQGKEGIATDSIGGYNGGGAGKDYIDGRGAGSGGGATHIAYVSGLLANLSSLKEQILIVSGGGGGIGNYQGLFPNAYLEAGSGGGYFGGDGWAPDTSGKYPGHFYGYGGNQTGPGDFSAKDTLPGDIYGGSIGGFGYGGSCETSQEGNCSGGGGGLYGGSYNINSSGSGGGGSGYIGNALLSNKVMYCYKCKESSETGTKTISTENVSEEPITNYAKQGNGYAKITFMNK